MALQQERGSKGEELAAQFLQKNGFEILERNFRSGKSEIDIICKEEQTLVFVEVKTRSSNRFGNPEDFVDDTKASKIVEGSEGYMEQVGWNGPIRFDIISVLVKKTGIEIRHFRDAFY